MKHWYARPVFFVRDAEEALAFYTDRLGFSVDWNHQEDGRAYVCQVNHNGFELILAQDEARAGHGRVFISLDAEQEQALRASLKERSIAVTQKQWGMPVIQILDIDTNELLFSPP